MPDGGFDVGDCFGESLGGFGVAPEQVKCDALGGSPTDAGQAGEFGEEPLDGRGVRGAVTGVGGLFALPTST